MILGTKARYAVMAMVDLALHDHNRPVKLSEIAERQEIPQAYLEQIFSKLKRHHLVQSVKGPGGGYRLFKARSETTLAEIVVAVDESLKMTRCEAHKKDGGCMAMKARCLTHDVWEGLGYVIENYFKKITLEAVCTTSKASARHNLDFITVASEVRY